MPEDLKMSQIGSSPLPPPFRGLHSPAVRKHCQIIYACYFRKSSIFSWEPSNISCHDAVAWLVFQFASQRLFHRCQWNEKAASVCLTTFTDICTTKHCLVIILTNAAALKQNCVVWSMFLRMYLWQSLCTLYLHACQVRVTVGDSGLCCCICVMYIERQLTPLLRTV